MGTPHDCLLVVEDNDLLRPVVVKVLESVFDDVVDFASPTDALAWLETGGRPTVILSDVEMPEGGGFALLDALLENYPDLVDCLLFMTGSITRETLDKLAELDVPVLEKPYTISQLRSFVGR